jgi:DnaJ-class molecular chaperone
MRNMKIMCPKCKGKGYNGGKCTQCNGTGEVKETREK